MTAQTVLEVLSSFERALMDTAPESVRRYSHRDARGIYAFYADDIGQDVLRRAGLAVRDDRLVYIGMIEGSFRERVFGKHIKGSVGNSTLRKTLTGVLRAVGTKTGVNGFMQAHLRVALLPIDDVALIQPLEDKLITELRGSPLRQGPEHFERDASSEAEKRVRDFRRCPTVGSPGRCRVQAATRTLLRSSAAFLQRKCSKEERPGAAGVTEEHLSGPETAGFRWVAPEFPFDPVHRHRDSVQLRSLGRRIKELQETAPATGCYTGCNWRRGALLQVWSGTIEL